MNRHESGTSSHSRFEDAETVPNAECIQTTNSTEPVLMCTYNMLYTEPSCRTVSYARGVAPAAVY